MKKYMEFVVVGTVMVLIVVLSPIFRLNQHKPNYFNQSFENAKVVEVLSEDLREDPVVADVFLGSQRVKLEILSGKYKGKVLETDNPLSTSHNVLAKKDMVLIAGITDDGQTPSAWIYNYKSDGILIFMVGAFFLTLVAFGGMKGFKSVLSLIFTGAVIVFFMLPLIFDGATPSFIGMIAASISAVGSFILISGFEKKTLIAILGTVCGVTAAGILSLIAGKLAHVSGINMESSQELLYIAQDYKIKIRGLMFTSILISSLGAVMDVAMSLASATLEIHHANPKLTTKELVISAMNVGKDMMGTMANTLILAFAGSSFNTMMLIWGFGMPYRQFINIPLVKTEIIQSLAGSIGIVLTVPVTVFLAVGLYKGNFFSKSSKKQKLKIK